MRLLVFGGSGMLGAEVVRIAQERGHTVESPPHQECEVFDFGAVADRVAWFSDGQPVDRIINCAGLVPAKIAPDVGGTRAAFMTNTLGPLCLASFGVPLIHMSTDCVFSGTLQNRSYSADMAPDPVDLYGRTKAAGEPIYFSNALTVRGSFIGPQHGFLRWLLDAHGQVEAYVNARWSGTSALRMAQELVALAENWGHVDKPVIHAAPREPVSKAWMIEYLADKLHLPINIRLVREPTINRALTPDYTLPPVQDVLDDLVATLQEKPSEVVQ